MGRLLRILILILVAALIVGVGVALLRSGDSVYTLQKWLSFSRYNRYDNVIRETARKYGVDPMLIKAVVWRESGFRADKVGNDGERGLMQVTEIAAEDWAKARKIKNFAPPDLFNPKTNLDAGTWYLKQALNRWRAKDDPVPFALAEYNAGRSRVNRWIAKTKMGKNATSEALRSNITFPGTSHYVESILLRYAFYKKRGKL